VRDPNGRAYNRTDHLPERRKMMQQWAGYLDNLKAGTGVIPVRDHDGLTVWQDERAAKSEKRPAARCQ
jgi:hypothetical protein